MKVLAENRRARFDYEILETIEAGIELRGFEVKSAKAGRFNVAGSYAVIRTAPAKAHGAKAGQEAWLINSQIPPYQPKNAPSDYDPARRRRLLLRSEEIKRLIGTLKGKSVSLVALRAYLKHGFVKIELGVGRAKRKGDKREVLKKRDVEREMRRMEQN